ncbi:pre-toxin TG domain-containing protein [Listeria seeligeri]
MGDGVRVVTGKDPITGEKLSGGTGTFLDIYHSTCESREIWSQRI